ncbi:flavodoxin family protein [Peptostreptococcus stomatis]|uniref:flavodoxin family protein n=1 Tax=Peptostreptococcus stomatis TaxID=341694 RepID=UPI0026EA95A3|nr:flavodoxin family protein [Peptostreptococcus stomatis]
MKIAVVYGSLSGNTERLARGVFDRISPEYEKAIFDVKDKPDLSDYDVVALGFWIDKSFPHKAMKEFIPEVRDKEVFLMGTMGYYPDSDHGQACIKNSVGLVDKSCKLMGYFMCNGKIDIKILERIGQMKPKNMGEEIFKKHMLDEKNLIRYKMLGDHVNEADIEFCSARFNERVAIKAAIDSL